MKLDTPYVDTDAKAEDDGLEAENTKQLWSPGQLEPDGSDVLPSRAVFRHLEASDTHEGFDAVAEVGRRTGNGMGVGELAVVHPGGVIFRI